MPANAKASGQVRQVGKSSGPALKRYLGATVRFRRPDRLLDPSPGDRIPLGLAARVENEPRSAKAQTSAPAAAPARASLHRAIPAPRAKPPSKLMLACRSTRLALRARAVASRSNTTGRGSGPPAPCHPRAATRGAGSDELRPDYRFRSCAGLTRASISFARSSSKDDGLPGQARQ